MTEHISKALRGAGQSVTKPRLVVFEALHAADGPIAASNLARNLEGQLDRASVYRTVALFRKLGFVRDVASGWHQLIELGDRFDPHHHHLACVHCGTVLVFEDTGLEASLVRLAKDRGYVLKSHQLELTGYCGACRPA